MALFRRKKSSYWWVRFTAPNGEQIRESAGTADRRAAQEYEDKKRAALWRQHKLGERPRYRWQEAVERWVIESAGHASLEDSKIHLRWVHRFLYDVHLDAIGRTLLDKIVAVATSNRLEIIRVMLRRAQLDWEWIDRIHAIRLQPNPVRRIRWLKREEADRLLSILPPHQAALVRFGHGATREECDAP